MRLRHLPPWVWRVLQLAVAAALLALLWHTADGPDAARILSRAEPLWLAAALAALTAQTWLSALRWRLTAGQLGISFSRTVAVREYYLAQIINQSLPGGMVGDAGRAVRWRRQAGLVASGLSVVFERLAGQVAMFTAMAAAFFVTLALPGGFEWPRWLVAPVSLIVLAGLAAPLVALVATKLPGRAGRSVRRLWRDMKTALLSPKVLPRQAALSVGTTAVNLAAFASCAIAVGADLSMVAVLALVPLILFTMLIPISVSGWGLREGAAAMLFPVAGASSSQGLAASIAFGLAFIVAVLPGLVFLGRRSLKPEAGS